MMVHCLFISNYCYVILYKKPVFRPLSLAFDLQGHPGPQEAKLDQ